MPLHPRPTFISFDIGDDHRRDLVRAELRRHGDWLQRSLWLAVPSPPWLPDEIGRRVEAHLAPADRLVIHRPCPACLARTAWRPGHHGVAAPPVERHQADSRRSTGHAEMLPFADPE